MAWIASRSHRPLPGPPPPPPTRPPRPGPGRRPRRTRPPGRPASGPVRGPCRRRPPVPHTLVRADRAVELGAGLRVLHREVERPLGDPGRLAGEQGQRRPAHRAQRHARVHLEPLGRCAVQPQLPQPPGAVLCGQRVHGLRVVGQVDPEQGDPVVLAGGHHRGRRRGQVRHRALHPGQPPAVHVVVGPAGHRGLRLAQRPGGVVGPGQRRRFRRRGADGDAGQRDRGEPRRRQQRVPGLLGQDGVLEQAELGVEPAELGQLVQTPGSQPSPSASAITRSTG